MSKQPSAKPGGDHVPAGPPPAELRQGFEDLGLSPYESRVLVALLRLGTANTLQLARLSEVPRTSIYQVLEALSRRRLAARLPGDGPVMWGSPAPDDVLARLDTALEAAHQERLDQHRARAEELRQLLAQTTPENPDAALPYVHLIDGTQQVKATYEEVLRRARFELAMFTRAPYSWDPRNVNPAVIDTLKRGVQARVLYEADQWNDPSARTFREAHEAYHRAGVEARLVDELPIKLVIIDREVVFVSIPDPLVVAGYPTTLLVEHPGFAGILLLAFEQCWAAARPLTPASDAATTVDLDSSAPTAQAAEPSKSGRS